MFAKERNWLYLMIQIKIGGNALTLDSDRFVRLANETSKTGYIPANYIGLNQPHDTSSQEEDNDSDNETDEEDTQDSEYSQEEQGSDNEEITASIHKLNQGTFLINVIDPLGVLGSKEIIQAAPGSNQFELPTWTRLSTLAYNQSKCKTSKFLMPV